MKRWSGPLAVALLALALGWWLSASAKPKPAAKPVVSPTPHSIAPRDFVHANWNTNDKKTTARPATRSTKTKPTRFQGTGVVEFSKQKKQRTPEGKR